jgi:hypothetical protein
MTDQPMSTWKRIAIRAVFGGIGLVIGAAAIIGALIWYSNRPKPTPSWNETALTATFDQLEYTGIALEHQSAYSLAFSYNVKNNTKGTYNLNKTEWQPLAVLTDNKTLSNTFGDEQAGDMRITAPNFIPADGIGRLTVHIDYYFPPDFPAKDRDDFEKVLTPLNAQLKQMEGIALFDDENHYRIDLPSGWAKVPAVNEGTKPIIDPSLKINSGTSDLAPCPSRDPMGVLTDKRCQPPAPKPGTPSCPASDPAGLHTKTSCTPLPGLETTR